MDADSLTLPNTDNPTVTYRPRSIAGAIAVIINCLHGRICNGRWRILLGKDLAPMLIAGSSQSASPTRLERSVAQIANGFDTVGQASFF
jgi:hypothetical protein